MTGGVTSVSTSHTASVKRLLAVPYVKRLLAVPYHILHYHEHKHSREWRRQLSPCKPNHIQYHDYSHKLHTLTYQQTPPLHNPQLPPPPLIVHSSSPPAPTDLLIPLLRLLHSDTLVPRYDVCALLQERDGRQRRTGDAALESGRV